MRQRLLIAAVVLLALAAAALSLAGRQTAADLALAAGVAAVAALMTSDGLYRRHSSRRPADRMTAERTGRGRRQRRPRASDRLHGGAAGYDPFPPQPDNRPATPDPAFDTFAADHAADFEERTS